MKNFDTIGDQVTIPAANVIAPQTLPVSGDPCVVGRLAGVAAFTSVAGGNTVIATRGVFKVTVATVHNGISIGETVFIDPATAALSDDFNDVPFGTALDAIVSGSAIIRVRLFGATPSAAGANS